MFNFIASHTTQWLFNQSNKSHSIQPNLNYIYSFIAELARVKTNTQSDTNGLLKDEIAALKASVESMQARLVWDSMAWHGMAWHGMGWHGMAWHG